MSEPQGDATIPLSGAAKSPAVERRWPYDVLPISTSTLVCLRLVGWAVAFFGVLAGVITLAQAPGSGSVMDILFRRLYLVVGWALVVGGIAGGILLNVVAGIGSAILDIWKSWHDRA